MRTTAPDGSVSKKSPLRINKQENLAAGLLPRGLEQSDVSAERQGLPKAAVKS
jgi:hypothetical protein